MSGHPDQRLQAPAAPRAWQAGAVLALMLLASFALHWNRLGSPTAGLDEQFYLLVGDRIWHGALPYVDIWDRKPPGLFLVYAAIRALPGNGILAYQLIATLSLGLTGGIIALIARRAAGWTAAMAAGLASIAYAVLMGEGYGQAPIFYDPLVAFAALCILRIADAPDDRRAGTRGRLAMLLCGMAITIKTVAVFEGCAFGIALIVIHARHGMPRAMLARQAAIWAAIGAAPMLLLAAVYVALGHGSAFWFANIISILQRSGGLGEDSTAQLAAIFIMLTPLIILAVLSLARTDSRMRHDRPLLVAWAAATLLGLVAVGYFHFHYALPMLAPLTILSAQAVARGWPARVALAGAAAGAIAITPLSADITRSDQREMAALLAVLPPQVEDGCLLMLEGPSILYHLSHACLASPYAFPGHFTNPGERAALGRPLAAILHDAMARRPAAVVAPTILPAPRLHPLLVRGYMPSSSVTVRLYGSVRVPLTVWTRRDLATRRSPMPLLVRNF